MDAHITERDFNIIMDSPRLRSLSARFLLNCVQDGEPPDEIRHTFAASMLRGAVPGAAHYDPSTCRFTRVPEAPNDAEALGRALMGVMNSALEFCERAEMVYFTPPMELSREMMDGRRWVKSDLCVVDFDKMMEDRAFGNSLMSNGKEKDPISSFLSLTSTSAHILCEIGISSTPEALEASRTALLVYAKEYLLRVRNRTSCLCLLFTTSLLEVYSVDRMGIYSKTSIKYHKEPEKFIRAVLAFADLERTRATFDPAVRRAEVGVKLGLFEKTTSPSSSNPVSRDVGSSKQVSNIEEPNKPKKLANYNIHSILYPPEFYLEDIYSRSIDIESNTRAILKKTHHTLNTPLFSNHATPIQHPAFQNPPRLPTQVTLAPKMKRLMETTSLHDFVRAFRHNFYAHHELYEAGILHGNLNTKVLTFTRDRGGTLTCELER